MASFAGSSIREVLSLAASDGGGCIAVGSKTDRCCASRPAIQQMRMADVGRWSWSLADALASNADEASPPVSKSRTMGVHGSLSRQARCDMALTSATDFRIRPGGLNSPTTSYSGPT